MNTTQTPSPAVPVGHRTADYYFDLPRELIAQDPLEDRSSSRLLVMDRNTGEVTHGTFRDILRYLHPGDALILNDTKVIPARLLGEREGTGASIEILLLKRMEKDVWECLVRPGKKLRPGARELYVEWERRLRPLAPLWVSASAAHPKAVCEAFLSGDRRVPDALEGCLSRLKDMTWRALGEEARADEKECEEIESELRTLHIACAERR